MRMVFRTCDNDGRVENSEGRVGQKMVRKTGITVILREVWRTCAVVGTLAITELVNSSAL